MTMRRLAGVSWAGLILLFYYRRAWVLAAAGPGAWDVRSFLDGGWRPPWPWMAAAAWRAAAGIGGAFAVLAAAWMLGRWVLWFLRCRLEHPVDAALFRLAAGLAALSCLSLGLAELGWYRPHAIVTIVVVLAVVGVVTRADLKVRPHGGSAPGAVPKSRAGLQARRWGRVFRPVPLALVASLAIAFALLAALAPEKEYDALWYHLWLPQLWLRHGHPVDVLAEYIALYPLGWELLYGNAMAIGGATGAKLLHFACLPLVAAATWRLARLVLPRTSSVLATAIVVTTPTVLWEATTAYADLALALYVTLGLSALLAREDEREPHQAAAWFRLAVMCLAFAATIKHLGLVVVALVGLRFIVRAAVARTVTRRWSASRRLLAEAVVLGLAALVLAAPWYWRAWSAAGNPFFPELFALFGARPPQRWDAFTEAGLAAFKAHFGFGRSLPALLLLPWNVTQHGAAFGGCLGPVFLLAVPGAVVALYTGLKPRATTGSNTELKLRATTGNARMLWLGYIVVGYIVVWASPVSSFQLRFLVPLVPAMSVLAAVGLRRLLAGFRSPTAAAWLTAALLALNLPPFTVLHEGDRHGWKGWLTHVVRAVPLAVMVGRETEDAYLRREVPTYGAWQRLASDARRPPVLVLEVGGGDNFYATQPKIPADATLARGAWAEGASGTEVGRETLARLGITHVLFDRTELARMADEGAALASPALRQRDLVLEYEDRGALLYRVVPTRSSARQRTLRPNWRMASNGW